MTSKEEFEHCGLEMGPAKRLADFVFSYHSLKDVLRNYGLEILVSLESMCNEYISMILHTIIHITRNLTGKSFSMRLKYAGRLRNQEDRVQRSVLEGLAQIMKARTKRTREKERGIMMMILLSLYSKKDFPKQQLPLSIEFSEDALEFSIECQTLHNGVKRDLAEIKAENAKFKATEENEAKLIKLEQSDKEKAELIAELNCDDGKIEQKRVAVDIVAQTSTSKPKC
ncbi:hypothetical protein C1645_822620 [Glomus cerebriforme]|uniref:Uncharacterized protein n=1 Tax=Glomus cerebriforme TaxID=658196 RepID=A0A397T7F4_9GLOM|nr:hypothetical protein C1645_822620 [Glomus cerebriforme]